MKKHQMPRSIIVFLLFLAVAMFVTIINGPAMARTCEITQSGRVSESQFTKSTSKATAISRSTRINIVKVNKYAKANFLFNWVEFLFPDLFSTRPATQFVDQGTVFYRQYPSQAFLADYQEHFWYIDPDANVYDLGETDEWLDVALSPDASDVRMGYVWSSITLDRDPGMGDCGMGPWADPDCMSMKMWWQIQLQAYAASPVLIIPDGNERWVITNHAQVAERYGVQLPDSSTLGTFQNMQVDPSVTNPECLVSLYEGPDFSFQIMGTREHGLTELILSANPIEYGAGACMQTAFAWDTTYLLNGWAAALSGDPSDLRLQLNDTFRETPGQYLFDITVQTNPSPENRDQVNVELGFLCTGDFVDGSWQNVPCPWE